MTQTAVCAVLSLALLAGCSGGGLGSGGAAVGDSDHPLAGAKAPEFDLAAQSGGARASLAAHAGKVVIVDFWATWCDPCRDSFPHYQRMVEQNGGKLVVLGLSTDDDPDGIPAFAKETGAKFPLAWDDGQTVARQYSPPTMPTSYVVDGNGIVRFVHVGFRSGDETVLAQQVSSLLAE